MKLRKAILGLFSFVWFSSFAGIQGIDSLKREITNAKKDTSLINLNLKVSSAYQKSNLDSAWSYGNSALNLSKELSFENEQSEAFNQLGAVLTIRGQFEEAIAYYDSSLIIKKSIQDIPGELLAKANIASVYDKIGNRERAIELNRSALIEAHEEGEQRISAMLQLNLGVCYNKMRMADSALKYFNLSLTNFRLVGDKKQESAVLSSIGTYHFYSHDYEKAFKFYTKSYNLAKSIGNDASAAQSLENIAIIYWLIEYYDRAEAILDSLLAIQQERGSSAREAHVLFILTHQYHGLEQYERSKEYALRAIELKRDTDRRALAPLYILLAQAYANTGQEDLGEYYFNEGYLEAKKQGSSLYQAVALNESAGFLIKQKRYKKAKEKLLEALDLLVIEESEQTYYDIQVHLSKVFSELGDFRKAYNSLELARQYEDTLYNKDKNNALIRASIEFENDLDELALKLEAEKVKTLESELALSKEKSNRLFWLGGALLVCLIIISLWQNSNLKKKKKLAEQKSLNSSLAAENERLKSLRLEEDLEISNKKLVSQALQLAEKNEILEQFKKQLNESLTSTSPKEIEEIVASLGRNLNQNEKSWEGFKTSFENVHESFFDSLSRNFPVLTPRELQMCALFRLNLSMKEAASLLGISVETVKKARYRIRKKLNLNNSDQNLTTFLMQY